MDPIYCMLKVKLFGPNMKFEVFYRCQHNVSQTSQNALHGFARKEEKQKLNREQHQQGSIHTTESLYTC